MNALNFEGDQFGTKKLKSEKSDIILIENKTLMRIEFIF